MPHRTHHRALTALAFTLLTLTGATTASAGLYLRPTGSSQGLILGDSTELGHESWIEVYSLSHGVSVPVGPDGTPSGPATTTPLTIMTDFDRASVKLMLAQANQESFSSFVMDWTDQMGDTTIRYELNNAILVDAQESGSSGSPTPTLSLSFTYAQVVITDLVNNETVVYDWHSGPAAAPQTLAKGILLAPSPNPTQGSAEFRFSLPAGSNAELALYDLRGHLVRTLHHGWTPAERTVAVWDGADDHGKRVAQGMYVVRLTYPGREVTQRITVLR